MPDTADTPPSPVPRVIEQLVSLRRRAGLSQTKLAERLGTKQSCVSQWETGEVTPTIDSVARYAAEFGMEVVVTPEGFVD